jgi:hypothetical protein
MGLCQALANSRRGLLCFACRPSLLRFIIDIWIAFPLEGIWGEKVGQTTSPICQRMLSRIEMRRRRWSCTDASIVRSTTPGPHPPALAAGLPAYQSGREMGVEPDCSTVQRKHSTVQVESSRGTSCVRTLVGCEVNPPFHTPWQLNRR